MKQVLALSPLLLILALPLSCQDQPDVAAEEASVKTVLQRYVRAIEQEDLDRYGELMARDVSMVNFGTFGDPIEGWENLKTVIESQNASLDKTQIKIRDVRVKLGPSASLAWATCLWDFRAEMGDRDLALPLRCTWVLEKREGEWKIVHWHKSAAAG
jgi:uncharacterized protein (TIGR02246 family)